MNSPSCSESAASLASELTDQQPGTSLERAAFPVMDDHRAHIIFGQSVAGTAGEMCHFADDGQIYARLDAVRTAMRNAASWVAEQLAGFEGVMPGLNLLRRLDHGKATAAEQLEASMALRLMNPPEPEFSGLRITLQVSSSGEVSTHTQGFNMMGWDTQRLLDAGLKALTAEIEDFRACPYHSPKFKHSPAESGADVRSREAASAPPATDTDHV